MQAGRMHLLLISDIPITIVLRMRSQECPKYQWDRISRSRGSWMVVWQLPGFGVSPADPQRLKLERQLKRSPRRSDCNASA